MALVEQPLPAGEDAALIGMARPVPVCADESAHDRASLPGLKGKYDIVNIKLDKTGGLTEALDVEFSNLGIRVTSLMPWFIDTPILDMGKADGANEKMSDMIRESGQDVYPVELAAEKAWDAAHGNETHYMAGKMAERTRFIQRFMPGVLKKQLVKNLGPRE